MGHGGGKVNTRTNCQHFTTGTKGWCGK